jgi:hypothetical protein
MPDNASTKREIDKLKKELELTQNQLTLLFQITSLANEGKDLSYFHSRCLELIAKHYNFAIAQVWDARPSKLLFVARLGTAPAATLNSAKPVANED